MEVKPSDEGMGGPEWLVDCGSDRSVHPEGLRTAHNALSEWIVTGSWSIGGRKQKADKMP